MSAQAAPGPFPELSGTLPGILDPEQRARLLRTPKSILSFASFDPGIAIPQGLSRLSNLSLDDEDRCRAKRIVIETIPGHGSFWRWVPRARKRDHVFDEGTFPRLVDVCGKTYIVSQDQWDIYKLDPYYDCFVDDFSRRTVITRKDQPDYGSFYSSSVNEARTEGGLHSSDVVATDEDDDDKMIVDDDNSVPSVSQSHGSHSRNARASPSFDFTNTTSSSFERPKSKRAANVSFQSLRDREDEENEYFKAASQTRNTRTYAPKVQKRARTLSPSSSSRILNNHRMKREKDKQTKWEAKKEARRRHRDQNFLREVFADVPQSYFQDNSSDSHCPDIPEENEWESQNAHCSYEEPNFSADEVRDESESQRLARLEESRRKMDELNADRPRQRQREQVERPEEPTRRARTEAPQESARDKEKLRKEETQRRWKESIRQQEEIRRQRAALLERLEKEQRSRHEQWERGPWSPARAVERYKSVSEFFDKAKFSAETLPLTWIDIPWPVLLRPSEITVGDINPESVAQFFLAAKWTIRGLKYKEFLKLSFNRFHPDRWDNRRLLNAIIDENVRQEVETASEATAKFVGAVYNEEKGKN